SVVFRGRLPPAELAPKLREVPASVSTRRHDRRGDEARVPPPNQRGAINPELLRGDAGGHKLGHDRHVSTRTRHMPLTCDVCHEQLQMQRLLPWQGLNTHCKILNG